MNIQTVTFHNQEIQVLNHNGKPYVAMKTISENIGLDWDSQRQRIRRNEVLNSSAVMITVEQKLGFKRELVCLPLGMLNGWLFGIEINRVKPEIREALKLYQLECFDVLYNHFLPSLAIEYPNTITVEQQHDIKSLVNEVSRRTGKHYQFIYTKMYEQFKVPRYQELKISDFGNVIKFLSDMAGQELLSDKKRDHQIFAVALMKYGLMRHEEIDKAYGVLKEEVDSIRDRISRVGRVINDIRYGDGIIHDGLSESLLYLGIDSGISKEAEIKAKEMFQPLQIDL